MTTLAETHPAQLVDRAIADNRLAHALLIHGQNFGQVEAFAYDIASKLMAFPAGVAVDRLLKHPDIFTLRPAKKSRIISVDDTRELIRSIQHSPQQGHRKTAIIFEVDRLHTSAANAFLKTLEEPPLNTTILLLTTRPYSLLATIRSRCQLFRLPTTAVSFADPQASAWIVQYQTWLADLLEGKPGGRLAVPHYVIGLYALIERFSSIVDSLAKIAWKTQAASLPEDVDDEAKIALESRISISIRQDFLGAIEQATEAFARAALAARPDVAEKLPQAIDALEKSSNLLRLNLKPEAMLESFLLQSLRVWTAKDR